jgi:hypothetical protein
MPDPQNGLPEDPREFGEADWDLLRHFFGIDKSSYESDIVRSVIVLNDAVRAVEEFTTAIRVLERTIRPDADKQMLITALMAAIIQVGGAEDE